MYAIRTSRFNVVGHLFRQLRVMGLVRLVWSAGELPGRSDKVRLLGIVIICYCFVKTTLKNANIMK